MTQPRTTAAGRELLAAAHGILALWSPGYYARDHGTPTAAAPAIAGVLCQLPEAHYRITRAAFDRLQAALEAFGSRPSAEMDPGW